MTDITKEAQRALEVHGGLKVTPHLLMLAIRTVERVRTSPYDTTRGYLNFSSEVAREVVKKAGFEVCIKAALENYGLAARRQDIAFGDSGVSVQDVAEEACFQVTRQVAFGVLKRIQREREEASAHDVIGLAP